MIPWPAFDWLVSFYRRIRPNSPWWGPIAARSGVTPAGSGWAGVVGWLAGLVFIYAGLFGVGKLVLGWWAPGIVYLTIAIVAGLVILWSVRVGSRE